jgi:ankyrin repeat protein
VELLLKKNANVNLANNNGTTALMLAAQNGHKEIVELLLKKLIEDNKQKIIQELSDGRCPISQEEYKKLSVPVEFHGKVYELSKLVTWIYVKGKDSLAQGREIEFTVPHSNNVVKYSSLNALCEDIKFVEFQQPVNLQLLLEKGADVNLVHNNGATALMIAARKGNKDIVELLLEKGADVNKPTTHR